MRPRCAGARRAVSATSASPGVEDMSNHDRNNLLRRRHAHGAVLPAFVCAVVATAAPARAITLADPGTFTVKRTWSATTVTVPTDLSGIRFSSDGSTLYAVGKADVPSSAIYAIPVIRAPGTHEIVDLGMASATPVFSANVSTPVGGLDSGPEEGPAQTLFYPYFDANDGNFIGERRAGDIATEMQFDL